MRMSQYYLSLLMLSVGGLLITATGGVLRAPWHLTAALPTAMLVVALHSLVILFVLIGSRLLREASNNCGLSPDYLTRSNLYFKQLSGLFLSLGGAFSIVAAAVLGYGNRAFALPPNVHLFAGLGAALLTLLAIPFEYRALRRVEALLDETRETLAQEDRRRAAQGLGPVDEGHVPQRDTKTQMALFVAIAPWCVYLYRLLIVWRGDFGRVSLHPWLEISALGGIAWFLARRREALSPPRDDSPREGPLPERGARGDASDPPARA